MRAFDFNHSEKNTMKHRISAGAFVVENNRILLFRHMKAGRYDFWVAPGGGVIDAESSLEAAVRETKEETGMEVEAVKPIYLEEFFEPQQGTSRHGYGAPSREAIYR